MKHFTFIIALCFVLFIQCTGSPQTTGTGNQSYIVPSNTNFPVSAFEEVWAYVVAGREAALTPGLPLTDIGYFGAEIDTYGKLTDVPRRSNLSFNGRVHLVVSCNGRALSYFVLRPGSSERRELIADLLAETRNYDGLQINFENIPARAGDSYLSFLRELRAGLPQDKMFTVALVARTRRIADDVYDYERILPIVDRILVMAYDEHWSGSRPGSVASMDWCRRVAEYSFRTIGRDKLIMGIPFYGRAWGDYGPSRALVYSTTERIINENNAQIRYEGGIPTFEYNRNVTVRVFFEDAYSLSSRMQMYRAMNVRAVGFWRLGQETPAVWNYLRLEQ
jgi:spore germination protein YaaH